MSDMSFIQSSPFIDDYLKQHPQANDLYGAPFNPDWHALSKQIYNAYPESGVMDLLIAQNRPRGDGSVQNALDQIERGKTLFVLTGQQMGLMVSPLYTIHKTLSAIKQAQKLNHLNNGYHYIPVFWLEGEDHDYAEVNHFSIYDNDGLPYFFSLPEQTIKEHGFSMNKRRLPNEIKTLFSELRDFFPKKENNDAIWNFLDTVYCPGADWLEVFAAHISELFKGHGLLLFNAGATKVKLESRPFFKKLIDKNASILEAFRESTDKQLRAGYPAQVYFQTDHSYIFLSYGDGPRLHLLKKDGLYTFKSGGPNFSADDLLSLADKHPEWFSSTVLTRPLWQSWLLPTVSYIGGAAEVSYWAQTTAAFKTIGLQMPQVQLRRSVTLLEPRIQRALKKYKIDPSTLKKDREDFIRAFLKQQDTAGFKELFREITDQLQATEEQIDRQARKLDPTLQTPVEKTFRAISGNLEKLHNRLIRRLDEQDKLTRGHLERIHQAVYPGGKYQERVIGALYFELRCPGWINNLSRAMDENDEQHIFLNL